MQIRETQDSMIADNNLSTSCPSLSTEAGTVIQQAMHCKYFGAEVPHKQLVLSALSTKVEQIVAVFTAASRQKAWDHFSKAQRKNIDIWRKQCEVGTFHSLFISTGLRQ